MISKIRKLIGNLEELPFTKLEDYSFGCIDGRNKKPDISTLGGDAGEFLLALDVYENLIGPNKKLEYTDVEILLNAYLIHMKPSSFKMCTDSKAIEFMQTDMVVRLI